MVKTVSRESCAKPVSGEPSGDHSAPLPRSRRAPHPRIPNLLKHVEPTAPGQVLAGDITYVATREGWLYLAVVIDLFGRRVPGWKIGDDLSTPLVSAAIQKAAQHCPFATGAFFHSDRGCQYTSAEFGSACSRLGLSRSLSRTGNCWDNAWSESFFASLKSECFPENGIFESKTLARRAIVDYL